MTAQAHRISDISRIEVAEVQGNGWDPDSIYNWLPSWRLRFADQESFDIHPDIDGTNEDIVRSLLDKLI